MKSMFLLLLTATALLLAATPRLAPQDPLRPGPEHELLMRRVGVFDAVLFLRDPSGQEVRSTGTLTVTKLGDFHTVDEFDGHCVGMPMSGRGSHSWCPLRRQFISSWVDTMTPAPMLLLGTCDQQRRELTLSGECFGMSGRLEKCRTVTTFTDQQHFTWALFGPGPDGKEMQHLRIEYTRRSK